MDYVFIDTNIIKKEQYFKPGNKIQTLKSLALKNMIRLVTTEITIKEIKANLYADLTLELEYIAKKEALLGHLTEFRLPKISDVRARVDSIVDEFFEEENIYILGYDYCDDVESVFSQYFNHQLPFGKNKKKNEFPDAFVLSALEKFSRDNDDCEDKDDYRYVVLSQDSDIKNYKSERLYIPDADEYLNTIFTDGQNIDIYLGVIFGHIKEINEKAEMQVRESLKYGGLYYRALGKIDVVDLALKDCKSELQKEHPLVSNNNDVVIIFDINSLVTINGKIQYSFEDANKETFIGKVELNMKGFVNTQISVNKSTMEISSVYSDEPDLFDEINKALLRK